MVETLQCKLKNYTEIEFLNKPKHYGMNGCYIGFRWSPFLWNAILTLDQQIDNGFWYMAIVHQAYVFRCITR